ncbi:MAG: UDP-2,3-diacylglucosamine diphosphatase [Proteobacteria bacterium]|nr:UDP-2,3-diacylglucosamine diphosphatase [Pseudomonadota bacterium]NOG61601.1 UDP-2,3-diacylglucosamine diphosphatase [Pseudomonadota bacterium]
MTTLFISDLHLSQQRSEKLSLFFDFLKGPAKNAEALYILGDLYDDFWIGCDDKLSPNPEIISALRNYSNETNTQLFIMRGNRDFHLNKEFTDATGCILIDDPTEIILYDKKVLLMHGDTLCTDDVKYQKWRKFITHPCIKWIYFIMPYALRKKIARDVRSYAADAVQKKSAEITDVAQRTVLQTMKDFNVTTLIHGHTHRQAIHNIDLNGTPAQRIVLGDWYEKDCILIHDATGFRFERVENYISNNS